MAASSSRIACGSTTCRSPSATRSTRSSFCPPIRSASSKRPRAGRASSRCSTGTKETIKATAKKCDQKGFDFCLELDGGKHGVSRYYSMEGWDVGSADAAHARIDQIQGR